jgi:hypothetical protein
MDSADDTPCPGVGPLIEIAGDAVLTLMLFLFGQLVVPAAQIGARPLDHEAAGIDGDLVRLVDGDCGVAVDPSYFDIALANEVEADDLGVAGKHEPVVRATAAGVVVALGDEIAFDR